jgi:hypothetical protein
VRFARGAGEVAAPEVHQEGAEPGRARAGRVHPLFTGREAADAQQSADDAEQIGQGSRIILADLEIAHLEPLRGENARESLQDR